MKTNVIAVDFDGILWDEENKKVIEKGKNKCNNLFDKNLIIIYTARRWERFFEVMEILDSNQIKYHAIVCEKLEADMYIDDKNEI